MPNESVERLGMRVGVGEMADQLEDEESNVYDLAKFDILASDILPNRFMSLSEIEKFFVYIETRRGSDFATPMYISARRDFDELAANQAATKIRVSARVVGRDWLAECRMGQQSVAIERIRRKVELAVFLMATGVDEMGLEIDALAGLLLSSSERCLILAERERAFRVGEELMAQVEKSAMKRGRSPNKK